ncbi:hypothetical protein D9M69_450640 [compost metagenome]
MHALGVERLHAPGVVELLAGHGQLGKLLLVGQQVAFLVDDGDLGLFQFRHAGRHQIDDRHHLARFKGTPRIELDQHRSGRLALVADEHRALRNGQVHARTLDVVQAGDGASQFAFQATAVAGGFHELAAAQALLLVEDFEAHGAVARGHAGGGELHAGAGEVIGLHQQGAGVGLDLVRDVGSAKGFHDLVGVHPGQAAIQRAVVRLLRPEHHGEADGDARGQADQQADLAQHGHLREVVQEGQAEQWLFPFRRPGCIRLGGNLCNSGFSHFSTRPQTGICMMSW